MKTEEIFNSKIGNKTVAYIELAKNCAIEAKRIANENEDSFILQMAFQEVINSFRKSECADCEYTAYVNVFAAETWLEKMITRKF